jgi:hypothetical protein
MTEKQIKFYLGLQRRDDWLLFTAGAVALAAFANMYFEFLPKVDIGSSMIAGAVASIYWFTHYLGQTASSQCIEIMDELINRDPQLLEQINRVKAQSKR